MEYKVFIKSALQLTSYGICVFIAQSCFNTTYCGGESIGNNSVTFDHCCFELLGTSFASPGQCLLYPKADNVKKDSVIKYHGLLGIYIYM